MTDDPFERAAQLELGKQTGYRITGIDGAKIERVVADETGVHVTMHLPSHPITRMVLDERAGWQPMSWRVVDLKTEPDLTGDRAGDHAR